jgi:hypothetical protein
VAAEAGVALLAEEAASLDDQRATILAGLAQLIRERRELQPRA